MKKLVSLAGLAAVMSLVVGILRGSVLEISQYAWLAVTSLLGSWAVLLPAPTLRAVAGGSLAVPSQATSPREVSAHLR